MTTKRIEFGCGGHFIDNSSCRFRRHTQIGNYRVSTIGNYYPLDKPPRKTLGPAPDSFFETMVFRTTDDPERNSEGCGCREVADWSELECQWYATAGEAQAGHEAMVAKYLQKAAEEE